MADHLQLAPGADRGPARRNRYAQRVGSVNFEFRDLADLMAKATPLRSGDELAGIAARSDRERVAAQRRLSELELSTFVEQLLVPYETDEVTRLIIDSHDTEAFVPIATMTVGQLRDTLLGLAGQPHAADALSVLGRSLTPEMVAAVSKVMRNQDLIAVAAACRTTTAFRSTIGIPGRFATRLQPNHPTDDVAGIIASTIDGLLLGSGDAVIGVNPAGDSPQTMLKLLHVLDDFRARHAIPTQTCVLTHVTTTLDLMARGAPVDLVFQSIAGTEQANRGFGITLAMLAEAHAAGRSLNRGTIGSDLMYFETGQGSALSASAHFGTDGRGIDQQTLEVRAYGVARAFSPLLVNSVVGFIGPEYLRDGKQIVRAGLEDHFCGKLLGLPMGVDVCYTNHSDADQDDMDVLLTLLGTAGAAFVITVPGADDVMLGYQSLSFHDALYLRRLLGLRPAPEFEAWLLDHEIVHPDRASAEISPGRVRALAAGFGP